jgi:hypothetical protein
MAPSPSLPRQVKIERVNISKFPFLDYKTSYGHSCPYLCSVHSNISFLPSFYQKATYILDFRLKYLSQADSLTYRNNFGLTEFTSEIAVKIFVHINNGEEEKFATLYFILKVCKIN